MSAHSPSVAYVLPAHNEERALPEFVPPLAERLKKLPGSEIIIVENGSSDATRAVSEQLARECSNDDVRVRVETSAKGYGNAVRRGIELADAERIMLTAADLPFGFSDLDAALALDPLPPVVIGSKAHEQSKVVVSLQRRVMSKTFWALRKVLLHVDVGDSQGTILIERELARALLPELRSGAYFFSTELIVLASRDGAHVVEVPVDYSNPRPDSKVRPVHDSVQVLKDMWTLRARLK
jgi:dolichyl-phosphate beta-glucosyltransferase